MRFPLPAPLLLGGIAAAVPASGAVDRYRANPNWQR